MAKCWNSHGMLLIGKKKAFDDSSSAHEESWNRLSVESVTEEKVLWENTHAKTS